MEGDRSHIFNYLMETFYESDFLFFPIFRDTKLSSASYPILVSARVHLEESYVCKIGIRFASCGDPGPRYASRSTRIKWWRLAASCPAGNRGDFLSYF